MTPDGPQPAWQFGEPPLGQTRDLAAALRRLTSLALSLEAEEPALADLLARIDHVEAHLRQVAPRSLVPRVGTDPGADQRVYIDHSRDIGDYNPCFPCYTIEVDGDVATGTVSFPIAYEGPPGLVHGGFLALFFDCAIQHHNCDAGAAGKTASLTLAYRRPTPLLTTLDFDLTRTLTERRIHSEARLLLDGEPLCTATMKAVAGDRSRLPAVSPRRRPT